jgi:hypothetical protein
VAFGQIDREEKAAAADEVSQIGRHRASVAQLKVMGFTSFDPSYGREGTKAIMRISQDKKDFWTKMDVAYPKLNDDNVLLPFSELPRLEKPK